MRSSYRRDIGIGNIHSDIIVLTEVATSTWIGDTEKVLEKGQPFAIHYPSRVCVREPKEPHWGERQPLPFVVCISRWPGAAQLQF